MSLARVTCYESTLERLVQASGLSEFQNRPEIQIASRMLLLPKMNQHTEGKTTQLRKGKEVLAEISGIDKGPSCWVLCNKIIPGWRGGPEYYPEQKRPLALLLSDIYHPSYTPAERRLVAQHARQLRKVGFRVDTHNFEGY